MDERTRRPNDEASPDLQPTFAPVIAPRRGSRTGVALGLIVLFGLILGGYLIFRYTSTSQPSGGAGRNPAERTAVGRRGDNRHGRYPRHRQRARYRHAHRNRHRANPDQRSAHRSRFRRRAECQERRLSGADRPAAVRACASPVRRPAGARSRRTRAGTGRPHPLPEARRAEFDRAPTIRGSNLHRPAGRGHGETRSGASRSAKTQCHLLPYRLAGHRPHRPPPGRSGKLSCRPAIQRGSPSLPSCSRLP